MLRLYNTMSRSVEDFEPYQGKDVGLYTCGPTVYNYAHLGNLRTYIFQDVLKRTLLLCGYKVNHVMNVTDVGHLVSDADEGEDKMELGAAREGKTVWDIAEFYFEAFKRDMARLNLLPPNIWCKATDHIQDQIDMVAALEAKGFTYTLEDGVYFDTSKLADYGKLARLDISGLRAGARIVVVEGKRNHTDFALWKFSPTDKKRLMEWDSPWGMGFPGWHVECSAMSLKYLGAKLDIHCGGVDHLDATISEKHMAAFRKAVEDDLNMPRALAAAWGMLKDSELPDARQYATLVAMDRVLGFDFENMQAAGQEPLEQEIMDLIEQRNAARSAKDFGKSDEIRDRLAEMGIELKDTASGTTWKKK